jgi:hypothetical protein
MEIVYDPCRGLNARPAADASDAERAGIAGAVALWNALAFVTLGEGAATPPALDVPVSFQVASDPIHGLYDDKTGEVLINERLVGDSQALATTIAHELGHAMGLYHVAPSLRASVMNPGNLTVSPTDGDLAELKSTWSDCRPQ